MLPLEMDPFFPVLIDNKSLFQKIKRRHNSTQPIEHKTQSQIDSFYERSFIIQRKELQCRTLEPKKQIYIQYPKTTMTGRENINEEITFEKLIHTFLQVNPSNPLKQSTVNKKVFKLIAQHKEIKILEEEHKSLQQRFFRQINLYLDDCRKF